jgi:tyrosine-protein kinase Etk/Wzc
MIPHMHTEPSVLEDGEIHVLDVLHTLLSSWRLLLVGPMLIGACALGITFMIPPTYIGITKILPPQQQQSSSAAMLQSLGALGGLAGAASGMKNPADQYVAFLKSRAVQDALVARFKLQNRYDIALKEDAVKALNARTNIMGGKDGLITIEVEDKEATTSAALANGYVEELRKLLDRLAVTEAQQRRAFFEKQLQQTKIHLTEAEEALRRTGVNETTLKSNPVVAVTAVAQLRAQITAQQVKLASMRGYLTESAPAFKQAQAELSALRAQESQFGGGTAAPADGDADYIARYRDVKYHETLFELFARQFELAKVDESREGAVIQVLDRAQTPERKSKPKRAFIALVAALIALGSLLLFVFLRQGWRNLALDPDGSQKIARLRTAWRS